MRAWQDASTGGGFKRLGWNLRSEFKFKKCLIFPWLTVITNLNPLQSFSNDEEQDIDITDNDVAQVHCPWNDVDNHTRICWPTVLDNNAH